MNGTEKGLRGQVLAMSEQKVVPGTFSVGSDSPCMMIPVSFGI